MQRSGWLRLAAVTLLVAWWPLATGNVVGCLLACRRAEAPVAQHASHHGTPTGRLPAGHQAPAVGSAGPCAFAQPLATLATVPSAPVLGDASPVPEPPHEAVVTAPSTLPSIPELPPPRA